jgi:hypothetical protein
MIKSRRMGWPGHMAQKVGTKMNEYTILVGKTERNRPLRRHRHR